MPVNGHAISFFFFFFLSDRNVLKLAVIPATQDPTSTNTLDTVA
jgi:hypothetical protein